MAPQTYDSIFDPGALSDTSTSDHNMSWKANMNTQAQDAECMTLTWQMERGGQPAASTINSGETGMAKRKTPGHLRKKKPTEETDVPAPPAPAQVTYYLSIFSEAEFHKAEKQRKSLNSFLQQTADLLFDTLKAQLLAQISAKLNPSKILYDDYNINWTVPWIQPSPLALALDSDYKILLQHTTKHKELQENITIKVHMNKSAKEKAKVLETNLNIKINTKIQQLCDQWMCLKPGCMNCCKMITCLLHTQNKDEAQANLETPLNHTKFNAFPGQKGTVSLLQCHLAECTQPTNQPYGPVINFNIPPELLTVFCPPAVPNNDIPQPAPAGSCTEGDRSQDSLIPYDVLHGLTLSLNKFCSNYTLSDNIRTKLHQNRYTGTETICYILISQLKEMEFKLGEIAAMCAAMKCWCK
ncbi:uncharacterized protein EDB91DRAFT_1077779 [Suillus paluster]|uniref:uncharacterized protein n=1 Tax=Suillus paluster TaxID=48578 RepID=UPI001B87D27D|nr:uncharacterized protein EDB91DRAFT_1077779 [Suillus paluster]KAG1752351.1 hypothetical protein EDB91DRAFT_1077779 [Suillus paluster]